VVTIDTNIAFYALEPRGPKAKAAKAAVEAADFVSVQVLNEFANSARRKLGRSWNEIDEDLEIIRLTVPKIHAIEPLANGEALRIAERYRLSFYDSLMIAVALENGATTLYSEDMQHGLVIDDALTITNPFLSTEPQ
jgi:predicted nucleic acid-binding protein